MYQIITTASFLQRDLVHFHSSTNKYIVKMTYRLSGTLDFPRSEDFLTSERLERLCQIKADLHHFETSEPQTLASIGEQAIEDTDSDLIEYYDGKSARSPVVVEQIPHA